MKIFVLRGKKAKLGHSSKGFTIVEALIAVTITGFLTIGVMSFYLQFYKSSFVNEQRNLINRDIRNLTARLTRDGRQSNYPILYKNHETNNCDEPGDRLLEGNSGDFLVFVYTEPTEYLFQPDPIVRLVGYFRDADTNGKGPVRRFDLTFTPDVDKTLEDLLPASNLYSTFPKVIELSVGLADGKLFYNFWDRSIMVNGQIHHGNEAKRITETYNFTISPRG